MSVTESRMQYVVIKSSLSYRVRSILILKRELKLFSGRRFEKVLTLKLSAQAIVFPQASHAHQIITKIRVIHNIMQCHTMHTSILVTHFTHTRTHGVRFNHAAVSYLNSDWFTYIFMR